MRNLKRWLIVSLLLNISIGGIGAALVYRRGGLAYLSSRVAPTHTATMTRLTSLQEIYAAMPARPAAAIFVGDSLTQRCPWNEVFARADVLNRGIGGETVADVRARVREIVRHRPRQIFLMIGINDLLNGQSAPQVERDLDALIGDFRRLAPRSQIVLQSVLPINAQGTATVDADEAARQLKTINEAVITVNASLKKRDDGRKIRFVDVHRALLDRNGELSASYTSDGLHLNGRGYRVWAKCLQHYFPPEK